VSGSYVMLPHSVVKSANSTSYMVKTKLIIFSINIITLCSPSYHLNKTQKGSFYLIENTFHLSYNTELFISPSGISELDCATTKTDTTERSISIGSESLQVCFVLGALAYFQVPPLGGSRDEKWRSQ